MSKAGGDSQTGSLTQLAKSWNTKCSNGQNPFYSVPVFIVEDLMKFCSNMESRQKFGSVIPPMSDQINKIMRLRAVMEGHQFRKCRVASLCTSPA